MRLLLHICCAPDATVPLEVLAGEPWEEITGYFYGSNIHPKDEFRRRAEALDFLPMPRGAEVVTAPYNPGPWFAAASPWAEEPEGGGRCAVCFSLQLRAAAEEAVKRGASHLCTTLTISPHKDVKLISRLGAETAASYGLAWEDRIWRKNGGFPRSARISRELGIYRQNYCGCAYSRRRLL